MFRFNIFRLNKLKAVAGLLTVSAFMACIPASVYADDTVGTVTKAATTGTTASGNTTSTTSSSSVITPTMATAAQQATTSSVTVKTSTEKSTISMEESRRWKPSGTTNRTNTYTVSVSSDVTRIELFYTAGTTEPVLSFTDTSAAHTYTTAKNESSVDTGFKFITKRLGAVEGYDNMRLMVIYIKNPSEPGKWKLKVTIPDTLTELACVTTEVPDGWESFSSDMRCLVTDLLFWYVDDVNSEISDDPISAFNEMWVADYELAAVDKMQETEVKDEVDVAALVKMGVFLLIIIIFFIMVMAWLKRRNNEVVKKQKRQKIVDKENTKVKKRKSKENIELDKVLDDYSSEYVDEDEYSDYFNAVSEPGEIGNDDYRIAAEEVGFVPAEQQGVNPYANPYKTNPYGVYSAPGTAPAKANPYTGTNNNPYAAANVNPYAVSGNGYGNYGSGSVQKTVNNAGINLGDSFNNPYTNLYINTPPTQQYASPYINTDTLPNPYMTNGNTQGTGNGATNGTDNNASGGQTSFF